MNMMSKSEEKKPVGGTPKNPMKKENPQQSGTPGKTSDKPYKNGSLS